MTIDNTCLLWIDMETTGLDAHKDVPLELGLALSDKWGNIIVENKWLCYEFSSDFQIAMGLAASHKIVGPMHDASGLWDELLEKRHASGETFTREELDQAAVDWLDEVGVPFFVLPMAGSSVGSLDRPFTQHHFPKLNAHFHYRNIDVSTVKELCSRYNPRIFEACQELVGNSDDSDHRVLSDIRGSVKQLQFYIDNFLFVGEDE